MTSIMRGNIFLRHFGYANIWHCCSHMGVCECACQWGKRTAHTSTSHINIGVYFKKGIQIFPVLCKHLETILLWADRPPFLHLAAQSWTPQSSPTWALPRQHRTLVWHSPAGTRADLRVHGLRWEATSGSSLVLSGGLGSVKWSVAGLGEGQTA